MFCAPRVIDGMNDKVTGDTPPDRSTIVVAVLGVILELVCNEYKSSSSCATQMIMLSPLHSVDCVLPEIHVFAACFLAYNDLI
jgi:hypothetical protein